MSEGRRWSWIPQSRAQCLMWLALGVLLLIRPIWKLAADGQFGVFDGIAVVAAALVVVLSVVGLVSPRLRRW